LRSPVSILAAVSTSTVQLFAALLAVATAVGVVARLVAAALARRNRVAHDLSRIVTDFRSPLVAVVTTGATLGSLYFSEVADYVPCTLCWYQRIAMYSLAALSITATIRRETPTAYFVVLAALGAPISVYHYLLERFPELESGACSTSVPCNYVWFEELGLVTLPLMALTAFVAVLVICLPIGKARS
jgi:disulfide bond formation protein DsbB